MEWVGDLCDRALFARMERNAEKRRMALRAKELERLTDLTYENLYGEEARNAANEKGLTGTEADKFVDDYLDAVRDNYERIISNTDVNATVDSTTVTETSVSGK